LDVAPDARDAPIAGPASLDALADGEPLVVRARRSSDDAEFELSYVAVTTPTGRRGAVEVQRSLADEEGFIRHTVRHAAIATAVVVGLCGGLALVLGALLVGRPIHRLVAQARRIGAGDLSARLRLAQRDELGQLGTEVDVMCDRLAEARERLASETAARIAALEQVRHADRLATVGKLAAGIAHEIGTPLNVISGHAQLITAEHAPGTPDHDNASIVIEQSHRVAAIIRQLLDFARRRAPRRTPVDLGTLVRETVALLGPLASERGITVEVTIADGALVANVDRGQIQQAITNLLVNALQATARDGRVGVDVSQLENDSATVASTGGAVATIEVADTGCGITADVLPHVFEPFFTTKDVGEGTGLGLSVAYGIVTDHQGSIYVSSELGEGSRFGIRLPLEHEPQPPNAKGDRNERTPA
jgi:signal transduction histidine kinase